MEEIVEERKRLPLSDTSYNDLFSDLIRASEEEESVLKLTSGGFMGTSLTKPAILVLIWLLRGYIHFSPCWS